MLSASFGGIICLFNLILWLKTSLSANSRIEKFSLCAMIAKHCAIAEHRNLDPLLSFSTYLAGKRFVVFVMWLLSSAKRQIYSGLNSPKMMSKLSGQEGKKTMKKLYDTEATQRRQTSHYQ